MADSSCSVVLTIGINLHTLTTRTYVVTSCTGQAGAIKSTPKAVLIPVERELDQGNIRKDDTVAVNQLIAGEASKASINGSNILAIRIGLHAKINCLIKIIAKIAAETHTIAASLAIRITGSIVIGNNNAVAIAKNVADITGEAKIISSYILAKRISGDASAIQGTHIIPSKTLSAEVKSAVECLAIVISVQSGISGRCHCNQRN